MVFHHDPPVEKTGMEAHGVLREDDDDEEEDTLSFCEFSINSDSDLWGTSSSESSSQNSSFKSISQQEDDCFEFFSQEYLSTSRENSFSSDPPPQNIVFCGKLISYREPATSEKPQKVQGIKLKNNHKKVRRSGGLIFRWKWNFFSSSHKTNRQISKDRKREQHSSQIVPSSYKSLKTTQVTEPDRSASSKQRSRARRRQSKSKEQELSVDNMSLFTPSVSGSPSRWFLFFFGMTKYSTTMELRDMKMRQSRSRRSSSSFHGDESAACMKESKGIWALLRALSCGTSVDRRNDVLVRPTTAGCIPLV